MVLGRFMEERGERRDAHRSATREPRRQLLRTVALDGPGYWSCLTNAVERHVAGGRTYDAIVVACALRARADRILTLNRRDFEALVPRNLIVECPRP